MGALFADCGAEKVKSIQSLWEPLSWWDNEKRLAARREMGPQRFSGPQATWWGGFKLLAAANIAILQ